MDRYGRLFGCGVFLLATSLAGGAAFARTYTVGPSGCDATRIQDVFTGYDLSPGDVVEVQAATPGGTAVYSESVLPDSGDAGAAGNPVVLRARAGDTVILDGQHSLTHAVHLRNIDYFDVEGFTVRNYNGYSVRLSGDSVTSRIVGSRVLDCDITVDQNQGIYLIYGQGVTIA